MQHGTGGSGKLLREPFLRRAFGHEVGLDPSRAQRLRGSRADRRHACRLTNQALQERLDGVPARDENPVVALSVDRRPVDDFDADDRGRDDVEAFAAQPLGQPLLRAGDGDLHGEAARSSSAKASGSSPRLRSIQDPSSAAIRAVSVSPS